MTHSTERDIVERVARAIYEATPRNKPWTLLSAHKRSNYEFEARAAIAIIATHRATPSEGQS